MVGWIFGRLFTTEKITILSRNPRPLLSRTVFLIFFNHRANFSIADGFFNLWDIHLHKHLKYVFGSDIRRVGIMKSII